MHRSDDKATKVSTDQSKLADVGKLVDKSKPSDDYKFAHDSKPANDSKLTEDSEPTEDNIALNVPGDEKKEQHSIPEVGLKTGSDKIAKEGMASAELSAELIASCQDIIELFIREVQPKEITLVGLLGLSELQGV